MLDGVVISVVGMLTVFLFLILLVASMTMLRLVVNRWFPEASSSPTADATIAAVAVAAVHAYRERNQARAAQ